MTNLALRLPALLYVLSSVTTACAWSEARPTLVLQLSRVDRAKRTPDGEQQAREFVVSASVSMSLDTTGFESSAMLPAGAAPGVTFESRATTVVDPATAAPIDPALAGFDSDASLGCARSAVLCSWAHSAEEDAFVAVLERHGAEL